MGFCGLDSVGSSDYAADLAYVADKALVVALREGLEEQANEWNTPGPVNVALYLEERIKDASGSEELSQLIRDTLAALKPIAKRWKEEQKRLTELCQHLEAIPQWKD